MAAALAVFAPPAGAIGGGWNENSWTGNGRGSNKVEIYSREDYRQAPRRLCTGGVIDQREVVTSAHCLDEANERGEPELWVAADNVHRGAGRWIHVVSAEKSPHAAADLAVPALDTDVGIPEDKLLHAYSYDRAPPEVGHPTTFIGFGKDATGNLAPRLKGIRVRAVENGVWDNRGPGFPVRVLGRVRLRRRLRGARNRGAGRPRVPLGRPLGEGQLLRRTRWGSGTE